MISAGELAQDAERREWNAMTDDERAAGEARYMAATYEQAERNQADAIAAEDTRLAGLVQVGPHTYADPQCEFCGGTGVVSDTVDYGSTTAQMESPCECVTVQP